MYNFGKKTVTRKEDCMDKELEEKLKVLLKLIPGLPLIVLSLVSLNLILTILIFL